MLKKYMSHELEVSKQRHQAGTPCAFPTYSQMSLEILLPYS